MGEILRVLKKMKAGKNLNGGGGFLLVFEGSCSCVLFVCL